MVEVLSLLNVQKDLSALPGKYFATSDKMPTVRGSVFTISMSVLTLVTLFKLENASDVCLQDPLACSSAKPTFSHQSPSCRIRAELMLYLTV